MNCKKCGNVLNPTDVICPNCSEPVNPPAPMPALEQEAVPIAAPEANLGQSEVVQQDANIAQANSAEPMQDGQNSVQTFEQNAAPSVGPVLEMPSPEITPVAQTSETPVSSVQEQGQVIADTPETVQVAPLDNGSIKEEKKKVDIKFIIIVCVLVILIIALGIFVGSSLFS